MATVHSPLHTNRTQTRVEPVNTPVLVQKTASQKMYITIGIIFLALGVIGMVTPEVMGMHFTAAHNLIHFIAGGVTLFVAFQRESRKSYFYGYIAGAFFIALGILGFAIGSPAYITTAPSMPADQSLWILIPNRLELGTMDHGIHLILGSFLVFAGISGKRFLNRIRIAASK